jgi:hypothetical protein
MSRYILHKASLNNNHLAQLRDAYEKKQPLSLKLLHEHLHGDHPLHLTKTQVDKLHKCDAEKKGASIKMSKAAVQHTGRGFFGDIWNGIKKVFGVAKEVGNTLKDIGLAPSKLVGFIPHPAAQVASEGLKTVGMGHFMNGCFTKGGRCANPAVAYAKGGSFRPLGAYAKGGSFRPLGAYP